MMFVSRMWAILFSHSPLFWNHIRDEKGIRRPFAYLAILLLWFLGSYPIVGLLNLRFGPKGGIEHFSSAAAGIGLSTSSGLCLLAVFFALITLIGSISSSAVTHVLIRALGGSGRFDETYKAYVYGETPRVLLQHIPAVGVIGAVYATYLQAQGMRALHHVSLVRSYVAIIVAYAISILAIASVSMIASLVTVRLAGGAQAVL